MGLGPALAGLAVPDVVGASLPKWEISGPELTLSADRTVIGQCYSSDYQ